ncbi:hypothetical protein CEE36_05145 [candidate division TA06 bacterium B3_TA06]|uniref:Outer membrane protein beta-barrel domain-containing protein n=1 Tax=candidate division TA06 bacterium B3_TA06 TaxID=2012487 RepID=A0A532V834_UNCT6|nr:MAG: hypothetical protein CEE36_05145 [candidate division TA06 bacterium B3_TA06]
MKKALSLGLLLIGMLAFSHAQANLVDIGINLGRDYVVNYVIGPVTYWSQPTITASPFHVGLVFAVSPVKGFKLGVRGGYSNKILTREFNSVSDYLDSWEEEITIHGGMGEFRILGEAPIGGELAFLYGGLGLGYYNYFTEYSKEIYSDPTQTEYSESNTLGWAQTFIAGAHIGIVKWVGFNVEIEKLGWQSLQYVVEEVTVDDENIGDYEGSYEPAGGLGDIGVSVALVFKI